MQSYRLQEILAEYDKILDGTTPKTKNLIESWELPVSPLLSWVNGRLIAVEKGKVTVNFAVEPHLTNPGHVFHGGMQCAILDEVIGITGATLGFNQFLFAIDFKVDYLRTAVVGDNLFATGKIIRQGHNIINCIGEIRRKDGTLISQAKSNLIRKMDHRKNA